MSKLLFLICCVLSALAGAGQSVIKGKLVTPKGRHVAGASIAIKDSYDGATADSLGSFNFTTEETGTQILVITAVGYKTVEEPINLPVAVWERSITMKEALDELKAVVVTAGTFEASDSRRTTVLTSLDIVTTASANADVTAALRTLPGTQQIGEKEGLFVRGGTGEEARVFIDGTLVNNFFFSALPDLATRGRFSPFLFKGTVFSSGGYSALYGQALSGALILETIDLPEQSSATVGVSTVGLSGGYQQLNKQKTASWGINYSYTNLLPYFELVKQRPDYFTVPAFHYGDANFRIKTSKTGIIKFYATFQQNQLGIRTPDIDSATLKNAFALSNYNVYTNLSWKERIGKKWKMFLGTSYSINDDDIVNQLQNSVNQHVNVPQVPFATKSFNARVKNSLLQAKLVLDRRLGSGLSVIRVGGEWLSFKDNLNYVDTVRRATIQEDQFKAGFAELDVYITNNLAAKLGTRVEHSSFMHKANLVPRLSMAYKIGQNGQASLAYGQFYQKPERNQFILNPELNYTKATHYIANYQVLTGDYTFRAEAFYKKYDDLVKTFPVTNNNGYGYAKGIEFFWRDKKSIKGVDYWVSYSFLDTERDFLQYPMQLVPNFAAKHTTSLVVKKFITKWKTQFNASYSFASGRPYYYIGYNSSENKYQIGDQGRTIPYNNLSLSFNYLPSIGKPNAKTFVVWVVSVNNVLNQNQVFNYNYSYDGTTKQAVRPAANQFFFLGCFLSFGIDRSQDIINSNL